jgi:putative hydrolase of the HAD superfamily
VIVPFDAVLFDYGHTLVDIRWGDETLLEGQGRMLAALGVPELAEPFHGLAGELWAEAEASAHDNREVDYVAVTRAALARLGVSPDDDALHEAMRVQIRAWDDVRFVHPDARALLDELRAMGLRLGYVSNTLDPPDILREVMADEDMVDRVDAIVLSSELGYRKPSPLIYRAALAALDADPARTLFVGDRVLEDVIGPKCEGMTAVLATWFRSDEGDHALADHRADHPLQVLEIARGGSGFRT